MPLRGTPELRARMRAIKVAFKPTYFRLLYGHRRSFGIA
jgi:hypothetical protein